MISTAAMAPAFQRRPDVMGKWTAVGAQTRAPASLARSVSSGPAPAGESVFHHSYAMETMTEATAPMNSSADPIPISWPWL